MVGSLVVVRRGSLGLGELKHPLLLRPAVAIPRSHGSVLRGDLNMVFGLLDDLVGLRNDLRENLRNRHQPTVNTLENDCHCDILRVGSMTAFAEAVFFCKIFRIRQNPFFKSLKKIDSYSLFD